MADQPIILTLALPALHIICWTVCRTVGAYFIHSNLASPTCSAIPFRHKCKFISRITQHVLGEHFHFLAILLRTNEFGRNFMYTYIFQCRMGDLCIRSVSSDSSTRSNYFGNKLLNSTLMLPIPIRRSLGDPPMSHPIFPSKNCNQFSAQLFVIFFFVLLFTTYCQH